MATPFSTPSAVRTLAALALAVILAPTADRAAAQCTSVSLTATTSTLAPSTNGTRIPGTADVDMGLFRLPTPPFPMRFLGLPRTEAWVSSKGVLQFDPVPGAVLVNSALPNAGFGPAIFAFWDDLLLPADGGIFTHVSGAAPNRVFEVRWQAVPFVAQESPVIFSVFFNESPTQPDFVISYSTPTSVWGQGLSATVGIQLDGGGPAATFCISSLPCISGNTRLVPSCVVPDVTYQGRITSGPGPVSGPTDLTFQYVSAAGAPVGASIARAGTPVSDGLFTVRLPQPPSAATALRISVAGSVLTPDQPLTAAPFAVRASTAASATFAQRAAQATSAYSLDAVAPVGLNGNELRLRNAADTSSGLGWFSSSNRFRTTNFVPDGPVLFGKQGGGLGTTQNSPRIALSWDFNGNVSVGDNIPPHRFNVTTGGIGTGWQASLTNNGVVNPAFRTTTMRVSDTGFFEIANNPDSGNFARLAGTGVWTAVSDARIKSDISSASPDNLLAAVLSLRPVTYHFKSERAAGSLPPQPHLGLIAQELREVLPDLVSESDDLLTVNYAGLSVVAVSAIQAQNARLRAQEDLIQSLQSDNAALRARLDRLEALLLSPGK